MVCAIARIDPSAKEQLMRSQRISERFGIPPRDVDGHITLATYIGDDEEGFISSCKAILTGCERSSICFDKIEVFASSSVIVAVPRIGSTMAAIQEKIARRWAADLNEWTQAHMWYAHTTLVNDPRADLCTIDELEDIAKAMRESFEPVVARVDEIAFTHRGENGFETIDLIELR